MVALFDTHQHLMYRDQLNYDWTRDLPLLANDDFKIEDYKLLTQDLGIGASLFMEADADDFHKETHFVQSLSNDHKNNIRGLIASIRPEKEEGFEDWLNETLEMKVVGFRRILHVVPDEVSQTNTFRKNVRKIGNIGKTFDLCFLQRQLPLATELAKACDNTKLILNHCGVPDIAGEGLNSWKKDIEILSKLPNTYCKLSGIMAYCAPGTASYETIEPYVDTILNFFGTNRIVWGSDWPVVNLGKDLPVWIRVTRTILSKLSSDEAISIANGNAQRIYKVKI
tara:strand:+ start:3163 stop:4008 length:846 start_codon:yes stop_codon:yes gene_type:complete